MRDIFEDLVFEEISSKKNKTARKNTCIDFGGEVQKNLLRFDKVCKKERTAKVVPMNSGEYKIDGLEKIIAYGLLDTLRSDNQNVNFEFSEDLMNFEPDEDLVKKSKVPLWVIQPLSSQSVRIKRIW